MKLSCCVLLLCQLLAGTASAHDFWMEPSNYRTAPGEELKIRLRVGDAFDGQPYRRNPAHLMDFFLLGRSDKKPVGGYAGDEPAGEIRIDEAGLLTLGYRSAYTLIELEAERFEAYLVEEELGQALAARSNAGQSEQPGREAFSRYAKTLLASGSGKSADPAAALGFELELIPLVNPYSLRPGANLPLRVVFRGKPLAGARVVAYSARDRENPVYAYTNANGEVDMTLARDGEWLLRCVHMVAAGADIDADWRSFWASLTFELPAAEE